MQTPFWFKLRSSQSFIVTSVAIAIFTDVFIYSLIVPVFPFALEKRAHIRADQVQEWIATLFGIYGAAVLVGSLVFGWMSDHIRNRRTPLLLGLLCMGAGTALLWQGRTIALFIVGRLLQSFSSAMVYSVALALLVDTVGREQVGMTMGFISPALSMGFFLGPLAGGTLYKLGGYDVVFGVALGLIGVDIILRLLIIENHESQKYLQDDDEDDANTQPLLPQAGFEDNRDSIIPLFTLIQTPKILLALFATLIGAIIVTTFETTLALFVKDVFHFDAAGAGLIFIPLIIPGFASPWVGYYTDQFGPRWILAAGFLVCSTMWTLRFAYAYVAALVAILFVAGSGIALISTPTMTEVCVVVMDMEDHRPGRFGPNGAFAQAYGLYNFAYAGGMLFGPILSGYLVARTGWDTMTLIVAIISFCSAIITAVLMRNPVLMPVPGQEDA